MTSRGRRRLFDRAWRFVLIAMVVGACAGTGGTQSSASSSATASGAAISPCVATPQPTAEAVSAWQGTQSPSVVPVIVSSTQSLTCGPNRLMFSFLKDGAPVAAPDRTASVELFDLGADPGKAVASGTGTFVWGIEDQVGIFVTNVDLPTAGVYGATFTTKAPDGSEETIKTVFDVQPVSLALRIGDAAPASKTPTLDAVGGDVSKISTDPTPVPAFYTTSIDQAVAAKKPFVVAFATPKFCTSAQCGPTLDKLKPVAKAHPDLTFINVEPYELKDVDGQLQPVTEGDPAGLVTTQAAKDWKLLSEPWIFVVDANGRISASFEGIVGDDELAAAIEAVSPGG